MSVKFIIGGIVIGAVLAYARTAVGRNMAAQS